MSRRYQAAVTALTVSSALLCNSPSQTWLGGVDAFGAPILSSTTTFLPKTKPQFPKEPPTKDAESLENRRLKAEELAKSLHDNNAMNVLFAAVPERPDPVPYTVMTSSDMDSINYPNAAPSLPADFPPGCLLRVGPNGGSEVEGFLDGDGMIHAMTFPPPENESKSPKSGVYSSTYVNTNGRQMEAKVGKTFAGSLEAVPQGWPLVANLVKNALTFQTVQVQKDTCNTAISASGGRVLATMEQCPPSEIAVGQDGTVRTVESMCRLDGAVLETDPLTGGAFSAHGRTCPTTGERIHVSYCTAARPHARVDIFSPAWELKRSVGVEELETPVMIHDCAITENYVVVFDFPLTVRPARMIQNRFPVEYEPEQGARIGLVPRNGAGSEKTLWFDVEPGVILHSINAYETEDDKVVIHGLLAFPDTSDSYLAKYSSSFLHEWVLDLKTPGGAQYEKCLNPDVVVEFPVMDPRLNGKKADHAFCSKVATIGGPLKIYRQPSQGFILNAVVKFALVDDPEKDITKGDVVDQFTLPDRWYSVAEPTVIPKVGSTGVYVATVATHIPENVSYENADTFRHLKSQVVVLDGDRLQDGPIWVANVPSYVPYGLHSTFLEWDDLEETDSL